MATFQETLAHEIWTSPTFQSDLQDLDKQVARRALGDSQANLSESTLLRLTRSAPTLSLSDDGELGQAAYRISSGALLLAGEKYPALRPLLSIVLSRRGNFPAIDLMLPDSERECPPSILVESLHKRALNTVEIGGEPRALTNFQARIWRDLRSGKSVAVSAPTSAGKSWVFRSFIEAAAKQTIRLSAVLLVPTRALINQMQDALKGPIERAGGRVLTVPRPAEHRGPSVYVLTQERLEVLLDTDGRFSADLIVVDEAQSIGDDARGVILQSVVDELLSRAPNAQVLFTTPLAINAQRLGQLFSVRRFIPRKTTESPVGQTIILLTVDGVRTDTVHASLWRTGKLFPIGDFKAQTQLTSSVHRLAHLAAQFGSAAPSIVYSEGQAQCENIANLLCDLSDPASDRKAERRELATFIKAHVHPRYSLAEAVVRGVGFHYGYIPSLVRKEIEHAFERGHLNFIVCTSTLMQGVNLPARNIFMTRPKKGKGSEFTAPDFWNLAGRAGRLGKEFSGNIFLIDYEHWRDKPLDGERETRITSAMGRVLEEPAAFISYVESGRAPRGQTGLLENSFARLYRDYRTGRLEQTLVRLRLPTRTQRAVSKALAIAEEEIHLPEPLLLANPWVSPKRQSDFLRYMGKRLGDASDLAELMPPHPEAPDAYGRLLNMIRRCQRELEGRSDQSFTFFANLATKWMRGQSIPELIDGIADYKKDRGEEIDYAKLIRKTLENIEKDLRFRLVRLTACYNSILKYLLNELHMDEDAKRIPAIPLYLEMGASSETMLSFMELGLSRITAKLLLDSAADRFMSSADALRWLRFRRSTWERLPAACQREVLAVVG